VPDQEYRTIDCLHHGTKGGGIGSEAAQRVRRRDHRMAAALELADDSGEARPIGESAMDEDDGRLTHWILLPWSAQNGTLRA
jgi:hypothetical protein